MLLGLAACGGKPFLVVPHDGDAWCGGKRGECCCIIDPCLHKGVEMRCVFVRWCSREQVERCIGDAKVER